MSHQPVATVGSELMAYVSSFKWGQLKAPSHCATADFLRYLKFRQLDANAILNCPEVVLIGAFLLHERTNPDCRQNCAWRRYVQVQVAKVSGFDCSALEAIFEVFRTDEEEEIYVEISAEHDSKGNHPVGLRGQTPQAGRVLRFGIIGHPKHVYHWDREMPFSLHWAALCPRQTNNVAWDQNIVGLSDQGSGIEVTTIRQTVGGYSHAAFDRNEEKSKRQLLPNLQYFIDSFDMSSEAIKRECHKHAQTEHNALDSHFSSLSDPDLDHVAAAKLRNTQVWANLWRLEQHRRNMETAKAERLHLHASGFVAQQLHDQGHTLESHIHPPVKTQVDAAHQELVKGGEPWQRTISAANKQARVNFAQQQVPKFREQTQKQFQDNRGKAKV